MIRTPSESRIVSSFVCLTFQGKFCNYEANEPPPRQLAISRAQSRFLGRINLTKRGASRGYSELHHSGGKLHVDSLR